MYFIYLIHFYSPHGSGCQDKGCDDRSSVSHCKFDINLPYPETSHTFILGIWETCHSIEVLISESISFKIMIILYLFHIRCYNFRKFYPYLFKNINKNDFYIYLYFLKLIYKSNLKLFLTLLDMLCIGNFLVLQFFLFPSKTITI